MVLYKTFRLQKDDKITFCWRCFRRRKYAKRQFPKDGGRRVEAVFLIGPRHEKSSFLHMRKQRHRSALRYHKVDQRLCFRYTDSTIPLLSKSEISSLKASSVAVQPGLCQTWLETPKTGFLTRRLNWVRTVWLSLSV